MTDAAPDLASLEHPARLAAFAPGQHLDTGRPGLVVGPRGIALQALRLTDRQHPYRPAGTLCQCRDQVTIAGIVAVPGQYGDRAGDRPFAAQGPPDGLGGTVHQLETGRTGSDQRSIQRAHLGGAVERERKMV